MAKTANQIKKALGLSNGLRAKGKPETAEELKANIKSGKYNSSFKLIKEDLENQIRFDTFDADVSSMGKTIGDIYGGWQTPETMKNTQESVDAMRNRLGAYDEYRRLFGKGTDLPDLSELGNSLGSAYDGIGKLAEQYSGYANADEYGTVRGLYGMSADEIKKRWEQAKILDKANEGYNLVSKQSDKVFSEADKKIHEEGLRREEAKREEYLKGQGYTLDELKKSVGNYVSGDIAYTTSKGENITWKDLYENTKYQEDHKALYKEVSSFGDFDHYTNIGKNLENPTFEEVEKKRSLWNPSPGIKNPVQYVLDNRDNIVFGNIMGDSGAYGDLAYYEILPEELSIYNFYIGQEAEGVAEKGTADAYLKSIYGKLKDREEGRWVGAMHDYADQHPWAASGVSVFQNLASGVEFLGDSAKYIASGMQGEMDSNSMAKYSSAIRGTVSDKVDWEIGNWGDAFDFVYNTGMSMADSAIAMGTLDMGGGVALGLSAAAQGTNDALERGLDSKHAFWNGISSGVFEGLFESVSIGNFKSLKDLPVDGFKTFAKNIGKSMLVNASEETLTEVANVLYDTIANGDFSQYETDIRAYMSAGMSESDAKRKVALEQGARIAEAGASGALMGFGFGAVGGATSYRKTSATGKGIRANDRTSEMFDIASNPEIGSAYETYTQYANQGINAENAKNAQLGRLYMEAESDARNTLGDKKATDLQKSMALKNLGKLSIVETENELKKKAAEEFNVGEETKVTKTGETIATKNIKVEGYKITISTENGKVSVDDVTLSERDAELAFVAKEIAKENGDDVANLFLEQYDGKTNVEAYQNSFNMVMQFANGDFTFEEMMEHKGSLSATEVSKIYEETVLRSYKEQQSKIEKLIQDTADQRFYKGSIDESAITNKVWKKLDTRQRKAITFIKGLAKATGMNLVLTHNPDSKTGGSFDKTTNTITIDVAKFKDGMGVLRETIIPTMSHEMTHWMEKKSPELYRKLSDLVFSTLQEADGMSESTRLALEYNNHKAKGREYSDKDLRSEIIARACEDILSMSDQGQKLFDSLSESEKQTLGAKIKEILHNLMDMIKKMLGTYKSDTYEARALQKYQDKLQEIAKIWDDMLMKSVEANQALEKSGAFNHQTNADGEVQFSFRDSVTSESKFIIEEIQENIHKISSENKFSVKTEETNENIKKSDYVFDVFKKQGGMAVNPVIGNVELNRSGAKSTVFHGFGGIKLAATKAVKDVIEQGDIIREIKNYRNTGTDRFIIVAKGKIDKEESYVGIIVKAYPNNKKSNAKFYLHEAIIIKADSPFMTAPQLSVDAMSESASADSISDSSKNVNTKFSNRDSTGRELSKGQQEYFKDSAVRNNDGNLLVMYHGTNADFTVFEEGHKRTRGFLNLGEGFYFTPSKSMAENYDEGTNHFRIIDAYLNVKKPFEVYGASFEKEEFERVASELENHTKVTRDNITESLKRLGYDGVISRTYNGEDNPISSVVVFDSSQAKLTSNLNPKENKDIRYSDRNFSYAELTSKDDLKGIVIDKTQQVKLTSNGSIDVGWVVSKVKKKCVSITTKPNITTYYTNVPDIGRNVEVTKTGIVHSFFSSVGNTKKPSKRDLINARVSLEIPQLLRNSIEVNQSVRGGNIDVPYSHIMIGTVALEDANGNLEYYAVRSVIEERTNQDPILAESEVLGKLYAINAKKVGTPNAQVTKNGVALTYDVAYTYNIAQFLEDVKLKFDDTFSEDVYKNLGMARKQNDFSKNLLFSDRETESIYDLLDERDRIDKEIEQFKAEIENLKERVELEKKVTNGTVLKNSQLLAAAAHLRNIANSNMDKVELARALKEVYSFILTSKELTWEEVYERCYNVADAIMTEAKSKVEVNEFYKGILSDIKKTKVSFSESQKMAARQAFDKNWNRYFFGRITISDKAIPLESMWAEWSEQYPDIFRADISDGDMVRELYDVLGSLQSASEVVMEYDETEQRRWLANEIYNQFWNVSTITTTADKYDKQIKLLKAKHRNYMAEVRESYKSRMDEKLKAQHKADKEKANELYKKLRERKDNEIALAKQHGKERLSKYKENAERKTRIQRITANVLSLNEMLVKNSKDKHVPEILKGPVITLIQSIDFSSKKMLEKGEPTKKDVSFAKALGKVKDMMVKATNAHNELVELYGHGLDEDIEKMVEHVDALTEIIGDNELVLNRMSLIDLQTLDRMVKTIKVAVSKMNKFHVTQHNAGIQSLAIQTTKDLESREKLYNDNKKHFDKLKMKTFWDNMTPYYAFKHMGEFAQKIFTAFQDGQDKIAFLAKEVIDFAEKTYTEKEYKEWEKTFFDFEIKQPNGETKKFSMNVPQIMSLYCVAKQEDAKRHILHGDEKGKGGGITLVETKKTEAVRTNIMLTQADLNSIIEKLNDKKVVGRAKEVAEALQEFMGRRGAELGNEISMARWGIKSFGIENYFPIKVSDGQFNSNGETPRVKGNPLIALLTMSFTHSRNQYAGQSIEIGDIMDVFAGHMSSMIQYNALALPVLDAYKWMNCHGKDEYGKEFSVQTSVKDTFGDFAWGYLNKFMEDMNGATKDITRDSLGLKFFKNAKVAKVAFKLKVALVQFTSYIRAGAVIDNKYLLGSLIHKPKIKKSQEHCGMVLFKSLGYYDTDITRPLTDKIKHIKSPIERIQEFGLLGVEWVDKFTLGYLWNACELEIRNTRKDLKVGSEEFYNAIGLRLREIIYRTQVVDSPITRSQMMRGSAWDKMLTSFASELAVSFNLTTDIFVTNKLDKRRNADKATRKQTHKYMRKAITSHIVLGIVNATLTTVFSSFYGYTDDDDEEEIAKQMIGEFWSNVSIASKIPYINLITSALSGFGPSRLDADWIERTVWTMNQITKIPSGKADIEKLHQHLNGAISSVTGTGYDNLYKELKAFLELFGSSDED